MKDALIALIIVSVIVGGIFFFTSDTFEEIMHPGQTKSMGLWVDDDEIAKYDFTSGMKEIEAEMKGDTYCAKCDKFAAGKVRICPYCGQYID